MTKKIPLKTPVVSTASLKNQAETVSNLYSNLSDEIFANFLKYLTNHASDLTQKNALQWQAERLNEFQALNNDNIAIIAKYMNIAQSKLKQLLQDNGIKVYSSTLKALPKGFDTTSDVLTALKATVTQTYTNLKNITNQTMLNTNLTNGNIGTKTAFDQYNDAITKAVASVTNGTASYQDAIEGAVSDWINTGTVGYFTDKAGKQWSLDNYARTNVTSTSFRTYNQMRTQPAKDNGIHLFYMSQHDAPREACEDIQGKIVYDPRTGDMTDEEAALNPPNLADYGLGDPGGTFGINCHHYLTPYVAGVNLDPNDEDEAEDEESDLNSDDDSYGDDQ